jgi:hypothetical protein
MIAGIEIYIGVIYVTYSWISNTWDITYVLILFIAWVNVPNEINDGWEIIIIIIITIIIIYMKLQLGWHPLAIVNYTFTNKQYAEYRERNIHNN